jgi:GST-like protein
MPSLSSFPITSRWSARIPIGCSSIPLPTPNGVKVLNHAGGDRVALRGASRRLQQGRPEDAGIPLAQSERQNPAIIDPNGPGGQPLGLFESGAILQYLAEKTGKLIPADPARRWQTIQWVHFQMAFVGPMFGQVGFFHKFAGKDLRDKRPRDRYVAESKRYARVMEQHLDGRQWFMDDDYHDRRHLDARLGAQSDRLLWRARAGDVRHVQERRGVAGARARKALRCQRAD